MKYTVLTPDSAVKFFGDPVALSSIISSQSIQKNYNYNTNLQVAFSEQRSETPLESDYDSKTQLVPGLNLSTSTCTVFPGLRLESRFQRRRRLPSRGEVCSNKRD